MNNPAQYSIPINSIQDLHVALDCEAKRARQEGFTSVDQRQSALALHVRNAEHQMQYVCPGGFRVQARLVFEHVPDVNAVLSDDRR